MFGWVGRWEQRQVPTSRHSATRGRSGQGNELSAANHGAVKALTGSAPISLIFEAGTQGFQCEACHYKIILPFHRPRIRIGYLSCNPSSNLLLSLLATPPFPPATPSIALTLCLELSRARRPSTTKCLNSTLYVGLVLWHRS